MSRTEHSEKWFILTTAPTKDNITEVFYVIVFILFHILPMENSWYILYIFHQSGMQDKKRYEKEFNVWHSRYEK